MFGSLRGGYFTLLTLVGGIWLSALAITDYPLSIYVSLLGRGNFVALWFLPAVLWLCWVAVVILRRRSVRPVAALLRMARRNRFWLARGVGFGLLLIPLAAAFTAFKRHIPAAVPYYADPWFADADKMLFLGHDPWRVTHAIFGPAVTMFLDRFYLLWFPVSAVLLGCFLFTRDRRFQLRGLLSYVLTWFLLGSLCATLFSSVGPVYYDAFYHSGRFADLVLSGNLMAPLLQARLLHGFEGTMIGSGISAMPSLHVAMATLTCLAASKRLRPFALTYAALIWLASVHLGWHYAVDGLFSIIAVAAIWRATGQYVRWLEAPRHHLAAPAAAKAGV